MTERNKDGEAGFRQAVTAAAQAVARANQDMDADDYEDAMDRAVDALLAVCGLQICILCGEPTLPFDAAEDYCEGCEESRRS